MVVKEVKELVRDPKILLSMIIVPLIMFPLMGFAIQTSIETVEIGVGGISMAIMDLDEGPVARWQDEGGRGELLRERERGLRLWPHLVGRRVRCEEAGGRLAGQSARRGQQGQHQQEDCSPRGPSRW